ncbi:MAG: ASCH domain-containing protein [Sulfuricurvum sp.]|nr:ASCH domain-containing protein [Sulfuricurvum sp.]
MKSLSIKQPWAEMIRLGQKTLEIRSWQTSYRGDLLICSSAKQDSSFETLPRSVLLGHALYIVELYDIKPMSRADEPSACCDYSPGLFAWHFRNIREIKPLPVKGKLGIFELDI